MIKIEMIDHDGDTINVEADNLKVGTDMLERISTRKERSYEGTNNMIKIEVIDLDNNCEIILNTRVDTLEEGLKEFQECVNERRTLKERNEAIAKETI